MTSEERQTLALLRQEMATDRATTQGKLDLLVQRTEHLDGVAADVEDRVRSLEKWKYGIPATLLMALAAVIGNVVGR